MITIYQLKPAFQKILRPFSNALVKMGATPNQVTISAVFFSFLTGLFIVLFPEDHWPLLCVPLMLFFRMVLNAIDGMMAREHAMQSKLGTFLNELGDVFSDAFIYLPFAFISGVSAIGIVSVVLLSIISEMTGVIAIAVGEDRRYDGPMGKSDRAFVFGVMGLVLGLGVQSLYWVNAVLGIMIFLLIVTLVNRIIQALKKEKA